MNTRINNIENTLTEEFKSIANKANQEIDKLTNSETLINHFRIDTMEEAQKILSQATPRERQKRGETFLDGLEYRSRIPQGMHDRGEAFVYANHPKPEMDKAGQDNHFPIYVRMLSIPEKIVASGEIWDITVSPQEWQVHQLEEMYNIVNVGKLILEGDAQVVVHGNTLTFTCQKLIKRNSQNKPYDIGILASPHGFGTRSGEFDGKHGESGANGANGANGDTPQLVRNFLGVSLNNTFDAVTMQGKSGASGEHGEHGEMGLNGGACRFSELNFRSLEIDNPLVVGVISGDGGNGGDGGHGGNGGNGGNGADSIHTTTGYVVPGAAGHGGDGGHGGRGGRGGHSGLCSNVYIGVPEHMENKVECYAKAGKPGHGGKGGKGGKGGLKGRSGANSDNQPPVETTALDGTSGKNGKDGRMGRQLPAAKVYVNNIQRNSP